MNGMMEEYMKVNGKIINSMGKEYTHGQMAENMKECMWMIKKKDTEYIFGLMVESMRVNGRMVNSMVKVGCSILRAKASKVFGKMVIE
jgi:hypothetical protein